MSLEHHLDAKRTPLPGAILPSATSGTGNAPAAPCVGVEVIEQSCFEVVDVEDDAWVFPYSYLGHAHLHHGPEVDVLTIEVSSHQVTVTGIGLKEAKNALRTLQLAYLRAVSPIVAKNAPPKTAIIENIKVEKIEKEEKAKGKKAISTPANCPIPVEDLPSTVPDDD